MIETVITLSFLSLMIYIYINEKAFQRGKIPFSSKKQNKENL